MTSQVDSLAGHQPGSLLALLALFDLRVELLILLDHFTFTSLAAALSSHLLAVSVLLLTPSLLRRYRG
jgi:hypothetical protein